MNLSHPHFADPEWLWLAVLGPLVLAALQLYSSWRRMQQLARMAAPEVLHELTRSHSPGRRLLKNLMLVVALSVAGIALARPQWGEQQEAGQALGDDLVFILDCSRSMLAADVMPSRMQRAKLAILDFMRRHGHSRLGLVAFAGQAFLQCPLTYDYGAFEDALMAVDDKAIPIPGTDVGLALQEAYRAMEPGERRKLLILLTDGEDLEKGGIKAAEELAKKGVTVFTIGVGTPAGAEIQIINEQGRTELQRDSKGEVVRSRLDENTLRTIAQATHGAYYPLGPVGEGLGKVRLAIESGGASGFAPARKFGVDRFHAFVASMILLLIMESLIGTRKLRGGTAAAAACAMLLSLPLASSASPVSNSAPAGVPTNELALAKPAPKKVLPPPITARDFFNAGTTKLKEGKLKEAEALLETALAKQSEATQPNALYNLGHIRYSEGIEELKKSMNAGMATGTAGMAGDHAGEAIRVADDALAGNDIDKLVSAYLNGRGRRKELKAATKAVKDALSSYGNALRKWERSSGDFKSALELQSSDQDSKHNADIVDQSIAKLVDAISQMRQAMAMMGQQSKTLGEKMKQLKGRIPASQMPPGAPGDDDEEEDTPMGKNPEQKEGASKNGQEMNLSLEQAGWMLDGFKLGDKRLPMAQGEEGKPKDRGRSPW
jgi:Ca-activated chloride channel homolog